ncbi:MAG: glycosyl hydrolase family 65 protein [Planctomycetaceae bacterium]
MPGSGWPDGAGRRRQPRLPSGWPSLTVRGIHFHDRVLDVAARADGTVVVHDAPHR